jgi:hypothetical protein
MPIDRPTRHRQATVARFKAGKAKPPTRKQAQAWLAPIRAALAELRSGSVDAIRGYPVTRLHSGDDYARIDWCLNGFVALIDRLMPELSTTPLRRLAKKLEIGTPLHLADLDACVGTLHQVETALIRLPRQTLIDAALVEQINVELERLGVKEAA